MNTVAYRVHNGLYLNITNRCTMDCVFCVRRKHDAVGEAQNLWLDSEPTVTEIKKSIEAHDLSAYDEIVFCGYGEPTERLDDMLEIAKYIRETEPKMKIRLNTNGHASLIAGDDVSARFAGLFDTISISLNAPTAAEYTSLCRPAAGEDAYLAMLDFAKRVSRVVPDTVLSVVDVLSPEKLSQCEQIAKKIGVPLRVRAMIQ